MGAVAMLLLAQVNPNFLRRSSPWLYLFGVVLLLVVDGMGYIGKGAQRWLDLGVLRFQPSEVMKLAVPMMCAWFCTTGRCLQGELARRTGHAHIGPGRTRRAAADLGTAALIAIAGSLVIVMAGLQLRIMAGLERSGARRLFGWPSCMTTRRSASSLFSTRLPMLGRGYHIIPVADRDRLGRRIRQGLDARSQAQLQFWRSVPTDFIFAVIGEEFGLLGLRCCSRCTPSWSRRALYLAMQTQTLRAPPRRSLALTFLRLRLHHAGMVSAFLPVVGVPLPLVTMVAAPW